MLARGEIRDNNLYISQGVRLLLFQLPADDGQFVMSDRSPKAMCVITAENQCVARQVDTNESFNKVGLLYMFFLFFLMT